jgi:hypothetical protein
LYYVRGSRIGWRSAVYSWSRSNTTVRGHNTGFIWKYPFYDTFINQWLKITIFFLFFHCGHNYTADQDLIRLHDDFIQVLLEWHLHQKMKSYWDLVADLDRKQDFCTCVAKFHFVLIYFCFHCIFNKVFRNLWKICFVPHYMLFAINTAVIF